MNRNLTVLIAEDNENDALLLQRAFRNIGLQNPLQIVPDGEQAIRYLQAEGKFADRQQFPFPTVLFLDIKMPRMSGFDVLEWVRGHPDWRIIPTMIFSSSSHPGDITRAYQSGANAYQSGANAYLVKPATLGCSRNASQKSIRFLGRLRQAASAGKMRVDESGCFFKIRPRAGKAGVA